MMRTGGSGMNAQANRLGTVAENIANANTTGYKRASTEFSSLILPTSNGSYNSGGVETNVRYSISEQGPTTYTTSGTDMAINGGGFFIVEGANGSNFLTRAGAFTQNGDGDLVNSAGYTLMGYEYKAGVDPTVVVNGFDGLTKVNLASDGLVAKGSTKGSMGATLNSGDAVGAESKTSLKVFDSQGNALLVNFVYTKTAANKWSLDVQHNGASLMNQPAMPSKNAAVSGNLDPAAAVGDTFTTSSNIYDNTGLLRTLDTVYTMTAAGWEYTVSHAGTPLFSDQFHANEFDGAGDYIDPDPEEVPELTLGTGTTIGPIMTTPTGLTSKPGPSTIALTFDGSPAAIGTPVTVSFDAKGQLIGPQSVTTGALALGGSVLGSLKVDITKTQQLGRAFTPDGGTIDGSAPSKVAGYQIDKEGIVYVKYENGTLDPRYRVALATVQSPDNLIPQSGNVYSQGVDSGVIITGFAGSGDFGSIQSGALEGSNVDIANELTAMIESQRSYTANSKVFQTGADLLDVLVNLKR